MKTAIHRLLIFLCLLVLPVLLLADSTIELRPLRTLKAPCHVTTQPAWHPNGRELAAGCNLHRAITVWDVQTGKVLRTLDTEKGSVWVLAYSPDGKYLAVGRAFTGNEDLNIYDAASGQLLRSFSPPPAEGSGYKWGSPNALAFSPDSRYLAAGGSGTPVSVFDVETGRLLTTLSSAAMRPNAQHKGFGSVTAIAYSPDGKWLAAGYIRGMLELWRTDSWSIVKQVSARHGFYGLDFSADVKHLAVGSELFQIGTGDHENDKISITILEFPVLIPRKHFAVYSKSPKTGMRLGVASLSYSNDGRFLFSGGSPAKVLNAETGAILREIKFTPTVHFPAVNKDSKLLAVGSEQEVRLYELIR